MSWVGVAKHYKWWLGVAMALSFVVTDALIRM